MNELSLQFSVADSGDCSLTGWFCIYVDGRCLGGSPILEQHFKMIVPGVEPVKLVVNDHGCDEGCCPGTWVTAYRDGDTIVWNNFEVGMLTEKGEEGYDPAPGTEYRFSVANYESQIESAKAEFEEIRHLHSCPDFEVLLEKLGERLTVLNFPQRIDWLMSEDVVRDGRGMWIRCHEDLDHTQEAKRFYEMLRGEGYSMEFRLARHPGFDRTLALLTQGTKAYSSGPATLGITLVRSEIGWPVQSALRWGYLRWRYGVNRKQPGFSELLLPHRSPKL